MTVLAKASSNLTGRPISSQLRVNCRHELVASQLPSNKEVSTKAEEYPLLVTVTYQQRMAKI
jgi:hypothetical protein